MSYTVTLTDGTVFATIADGTINTSSSMTLVGKNYAGYGQFLDTNFIRSLENASNSTSPRASPGRSSGLTPMRRRIPTCRRRNISAA